VGSRAGQTTLAFWDTPLFNLSIIQNLRRLWNAGQRQMSAGPVFSLPLFRSLGARRGRPCIL